MSCEPAQGFLEQHDLAVTAMADAKRQRQGRHDELARARAAAHAIVLWATRGIAEDGTFPALKPKRAQDPPVTSPARSIASVRRLRRSGRQEYSFISSIRPVNSPR